MTYPDALAFCEWLSQKEGKVYRLATEAEWEMQLTKPSTIVTGRHIPGKMDTRELLHWPGLDPMHLDSTTCLGVLILVFMLLSFE